MSNSKVMLVALALLLVACADQDQISPADTTTLPEPAEPASTTTVPEITTAETEDVPTETEQSIPADTQTPHPTSPQQEQEPATDPARDDQPTDPADAEQPGEDSATPEESETTQSHTEPTDAETVAMEPVEGETGDDVSSEAQPDETEPVEEPEDIRIKRVIVWEGVNSEERCLVAGGIWADTHCEYWVFADPADGLVDTYWHPTLMDDAYQAVDPETVEADHWETFQIGGPWGFYNYAVFFHFDAVSDEDRDTQFKVLRQVSQYAVRWAFMYSTDWLWFPYRYDVSWDEQPDTVKVVGSYPLGKERTLTIHVDPDQRQTLDIDQPLPLPPPIRPTTPFAPPEYDLDDMGQGCPPVEETWDGYGTEVTDPCTLKAIETAVDWAWRGDPTLRELAIRDGYALADFLQELEHFEDPYDNALLGYESRVGGAILLQDIKWAGQWPGASMISLEWRVVYSYREFTPEENTGRKRYYAALLQRGYDVHEHYLKDDLTLDEEGWGWAEALMVRTRDGTWRMSQRSFCWWYERIIRIDQEEILCPEDPNPHFPDSAFFDDDIYPPNHKNYYQDPRSNYPLRSLPHQDRGQPRRTGLYEGVPPS